MKKKRAPLTNDQMRLAGFEAEVYDLIKTFRDQSPSEILSPCRTGALDERETWLLMEITRAAKRMFVPAKATNER